MGMGGDLNIYRGDVLFFPCYTLVNYSDIDIALYMTGDNERPIFLFGFVLVTFCSVLFW